MAAVASQEARPIGSVPTVRIGGGGGGGTGTGTGLAQAVVGMAKTVPLQEEEVVQAIRLLTRFGEVATNPNVAPEDLQKELRRRLIRIPVNLQQLLESLAATFSTENDTPLLMKAAEHMAIRFALERYQKGEVKVNAVHQMLEHMSRQMDTLRQILRMQEDKMGKAGILVESHADILDRMFWSEVPEAGKKSVLLSNEAPCVPPRNIRQFVEILLERGDKETADEILKNYFNCLDAKDAEPRRKDGDRAGQLADLYPGPGGDLMALRHQRVGEQICKEQDTELQGMLSAAFVRLSQEASTRKSYGAVAAVCASMELVAKARPVLANDLRPRIGVENRLPEFIEEALRAEQVPAEICWKFCGAPARQRWNTWRTASSAACGATNATA